MQKVGKNKKSDRQDSGIRRKRKTRKTQKRRLSRVSKESGVSGSERVGLPIFEVRKDSEERRTFVEKAKLSGFRYSPLSESYSIGDLLL